MRFFRLSSVVMLLGLLLAACGVNDVTAEQIMQRMEAARNKLQTAYVTADLTLNTPDKSGTFTVESWAKKTDQTDAAGRPITKLRAKVLKASGGENNQAADLVGTEFVNDGETFWLYTPKENKVVTGKLSELKQADGAAQDPAAQMMQFQEMLQNIIDGSDVTIENPSEEIAGRKTWRIKLTPKPETQQQMQLGSAIDTILWIDQATDLPVQAEIDARDLGKVKATATTLDLNQPIDDGQFTFTPPAGAEIVDAAKLIEQARPQTTTLEAARTQVAFPLLTPQPLPDGVQLEEVQVMQMGGATVIQNYGGTTTFSLVQGKGSIPGAERAPNGAQSQDVTVRGQPATLITGGAGAEQGTLLRWQENGITIVIAGTLSADQATAVAATLK